MDLEALQRPHFAAFARSAPAEPLAAPRDAKFFVSRRPQARQPATTAPRREGGPRELGGAQPGLNKDKGRPRPAGWVEPTWAFVPHQPGHGPSPALALAIPATRAKGAGLGSPPLASQSPVAEAALQTLPEEASDTLGSLKQRRRGPRPKTPTSPGGPSPATARPPSGMSASSVLAAAQSAGVSPEDAPLVGAATMQKLADGRRLLLELAASSREPAQARALPGGSWPTSAASTGQFSAEDLDRLAEQRRRCAGLIDALYQVKIDSYVTSIRHSRNPMQLQREWSGHSRLAVDRFAPRFGHARTFSGETGNRSYPSEASSRSSKSSGFSLFSKASKPNLSRTGSYDPTVPTEAGSTRSSLPQTISIGSVASLVDAVRPMSLSLSEPGRLVQLAGHIEAFGRLGLGQQEAVPSVDVALQGATDVESQLTSRYILGHAIRATNALVGPLQRSLSDQSLRDEPGAHGSYAPLAL